MDSGRSKSLALFGLIGLFMVVGVVFSFLILPKMRVESERLFVFPLDEADLRVMDMGVTLFCSDGSKGMSFDVREGARVAVLGDGVVSSVRGDVLIVDMGDSILTELYPVRNISVVEGDYVLSGDMVGFVDGNVFTFLITRDGKYVCPYVYLNDDGKGVINRLLDRVEYFGKICLCDDLN